MSKRSIPCSLNLSCGTFKQLSSIPLFEKPDSSILDKDFQNLTLTESQNKKFSFPKISRKGSNVSEIQKCLMDEFNAGVNYSSIETEKETINQRKESTKSTRSFDLLNQNESIEIEISKREKQDRVKKLTYSATKRSNRDKQSTNLGIFPRIKHKKKNTDSQKIEISYSKCMMNVFQKYFKDSKNNKSINENDHLLKFLISSLQKIITPESSPSSSDIQRAIELIQFPFSESGLTFITQNLLTLCCCFPPLEQPILNSLLRHSIKLDSELSEIKSTSNLFPVPQAHHPRNSLSTFVRKSSPVIPRRSLLRPLTLFSEPLYFEEQSSLYSAFAPNFSSSLNEQASSNLESLLLLLTVYVKLRLQDNPSFSPFFKDPRRDPRLRNFLEYLNKYSQQGVQFRKMSKTADPRFPKEDVEKLSKRHLANFLIDFFTKKILKLQKTNVIQFFLFICVSLKTPLLNASPGKHYMKERFFEKLILDVFSTSTNTRSKLNSLDYMYGFISNSKRIPHDFLFIVFKYLTKLMIFYMKKTLKKAVKLFGSSLDRLSFSKMSSKKKLHFLKLFGQPIWVRIIYYQSKLLKMNMKELTTDQYCRLVKMHENFLKRSKK